VKGFSQKGVDYEETFAPIAKYMSIRVVMSLVSYGMEDTSYGYKDNFPKWYD
jgi:hypothetical protein